MRKLKKRSEVRDAAYREIRAEILGVNEMPRGKRSSIKDEKTYKELRKKGESKEKAARIANAQANSKQSPSKKGGRRNAYEDWTKDALYKRAVELNISGRSKMDKGELIDALRNS